MMRRSDLKKYSKQQNIPFAQVLGWYVAGLVLYFTEKTDFNQNLLVKNPVSLDPHQDVHILEDGIRCCTEKQIPTQKVQISINQAISYNPMSFAWVVLIIWLLWERYLTDKKNIFWELPVILVSSATIIVWILPIAHLL